MKHIHLKIIILGLVFFSDISTFAQCAMCKAVVENGDGGLAKGLNDGIITLMVIPYILAALAGYFLYRNYKKNKSKDVS